MLRRTSILGSIGIQRREERGGHLAPDPSLPHLDEHQMRSKLGISQSQFSPRELPAHAGFAVPGAGIATKDPASTLPPNQHTGCRTVPGLPQTVFRIAERKPVDCLTAGAAEDQRRNALHLTVPRNGDREQGLPRHIARGGANGSGLVGSLKSGGCPAEPGEVLTTSPSAAPANSRRVEAHLMLFAVLITGILLKSVEPC